MGQDEVSKLTARYCGPFPIIRQTSPLRMNSTCGEQHSPNRKFVNRGRGGHGHRFRKRRPRTSTDESICYHNTKGGAKKYREMEGIHFRGVHMEQEKSFKSHTLRDYHAKRKADKDEESASDDERYGHDKRGQACQSVPTGMPRGLEGQQRQPLRSGAGNHHPSEAKRYHSVPVDADTTGISNVIS